MDLSRYGPSVNPLAAALASGQGYGGTPGYSSSGYGAGPSSVPRAVPNGVGPSIPGLPPGIMPLPPSAAALGIGGTGVPQTPGAISPGSPIAPFQGAPAIAPISSAGGAPFGFGSLQSYGVGVG